jgi:hypothetical protein
MKNRAQSLSEITNRTKIKAICCQKKMMDQCTEEFRKVSQEN